MPSCVRILRITLMVELENWPDTGNKKQRIKFSGNVVTTTDWRTGTTAAKLTNADLKKQETLINPKESARDYISLYPALPLPPAFLF